MSNIFIVGTRAQLIKVAPVIYFFEKEQLPVTFILTGQHRDTMQDLIDEFQIQTHPIHLIPNNKEHSNILALLSWLPKIFKLLINFLGKYKNANVFVHGDTLTTLASAVSAKLTNNKVIHLESGLTSKQLLSPFPEEMIRRIVFRTTNIACCPTRKDFDHIQKHYPKTTALNTFGNTIVDSINLLNINKSNTSESQESIVVSIHRFQNIYNKERLSEISKMLNTLSEKYILNFVLHPATEKKLKKFKLFNDLDHNKRINLLPRMTYQNFLTLALDSDVVITDGGSNQEELAFFGHPTIILRDHTERQDGIGSNAILINEIPNLTNYIINHKFIELKHSRSILHNSPSQLITNYFKTANTYDKS
ncbi:UDP-N-acetylglucosamine 2-epimerase [Acinetobacter sp.]|uniref:UDP-N-acetylglucosamine 2-epimerase n=1 Tax=Acinetobacter sp. TaxID=472 RepID=UPI0035B46A4A